MDCRGQGGLRRDGLRRIGEGTVHDGRGDVIPSGGDGDGMWRLGRRHHTGPDRAGYGDVVILHDDIRLISQPAHARVVHNDFPQDHFS